MRFSDSPELMLPIAVSDYLEPRKPDTTLLVDGTKDDPNFVTAIVYK